MCGAGYRDRDESGIGVLERPRRAWWGGGWPRAAGGVKDVEGQGGGTVGVVGVLQQQEERVAAREEREREAQRDGGAVAQ